MFKMPLEAFTQDESFPFYIHYGFHDTDVSPHSHDGFSELVIVLNGSALHIVDGEQYPIRQGDVFVIGADTEHGYEAPKEFRICNIMFRSRFMNLFDFDIAEAAGFHALFVLEPRRARSSKFKSHLRLSGSDFPEVFRIVDALMKEYNDRPSGWKTMVKADFLRLVVMLSRLYDLEQLEEKAGIVKLAPVIAYIEQHYHEPLSVTYLAALSHYSERQFIRLFKEAFGCVPLQYITKLRMQDARELLLTSSLSVSDIAARCGYTDSNYFSKLFCRYYDATPRAFRKAARTG